jgi:Ser/Thr protein kinase RdoA (MazF antagonist)
MAAQLAQGLAPLPAPPPPPDLLWSFDRLPELNALAADLEPDLRARIDPILDDLCGPVLARYHALPVQLVHNDLNPSNVFVAGTGVEARISGIIDFGDMLAAPRLGDLAVLLTYLVGQGDTALDLPRAVARGYHAQAPLSADEWALLPRLMLARAVMSILIATARARAYPDNAPYLLRNRAPVLRVLDLLADPQAPANALIRGAADDR